MDPILKVLTYPSGIHFIDRSIKNSPKLYFILFIFFLPTRGDQAQVRPASNTDLVHLLPPLPHATPALRDSDELVGNSLRKLGVAPLVGGVDDPLDRGAAPLAQSQRDRDLQRRTTTGDTFLLPDLDERGNGVHDQGQVKDGVEGKLSRWWRLKEAALWVQLGRWSSAKMVEDEGHVLFNRSQLLTSMLKTVQKYSSNVSQRTYLLSDAQLAILHQQLRKLVNQRLVSSPEILRPGQRRLRHLELQTRFKRSLRDLVGDRRDGRVYLLALLARRRRRSVLCLWLLWILLLQFLLPEDGRGRI